MDSDEGLAVIGRMAASERVLSARDVTFSIITVTKDAGQHIQACIESVARQRYPRVQHVIVDGASTDATTTIARRLLRSHDVLLSEPDAGIYDAMNRGIGLCSGKYILFLGADDRLIDADVLDDAAAFIAGADWPGLVYGDIEVRQAGLANRVFRPPEPSEALDFMICGCLPHQATFARRDLFAGVVGLFDTQYRVQADYDWFLRALAVPDLDIRHMNRVVASFALGGASSRLQVGQMETYAIQNSFDLYRRADWVEKRLHEFQRQVLVLRLQAQNEQTQLVQKRSMLERVWARVRGQRA